MAYQIVAMAVTLNDLEGHSPVADVFTCNPSNICAAFYTISTDSVLAWFLWISRASCQQLSQKTAIIFQLTQRVARFLCNSRASCRDNSQVRQRFFSIRLINMWNNLPADTTGFSTHRVFCSSIKRLFARNSVLLILRDFCDFLHCHDASSTVCDVVVFIVCHIFLNSSNL